MATSAAPGAAAAAAPPETPKPVNIDVLAAAALKGDLQFEDPTGTGLALTYTRGLEAVTGTLSQHVRPTATGADLVRLLQHPDTADLAHSMLHTLICDQYKGGGTWAEIRAAGTARLPFATAQSAVLALLQDLENRTAALSARLNDATGSTGGASSPASSSRGTGAGTGASADGASTALVEPSLQRDAMRLGQTARMVVYLHMFYDPKPVGLAMRAFGLERLCRVLCSAMQAVNSAVPTVAIDLHLRVARMLTVMNTACMYAWNSNDAGGVDALVVADEYTRSINGHAVKLVEGVTPLVRSENPQVFKHAWWSGIFVSICDVESTANTFASVGLPVLLRACTDSSRREQLSSLLIAIGNAVRFAPAAKCAVECNAAGLLMPLVYHDTPSIALSACRCICLLAFHAELYPAVEASGALVDVTAALRALLPGHQEQFSGFADADVIPMLSMLEKDRPSVLRLNAAVRLAEYARGANADSSKGAILTRLGVLDAVREAAQDSDPFLFVAAVRVLILLGSPLPYYRDPARTAAQGGATSNVTHVLQWSIDDVSNWVGKQPFRQFRAMFREALVDGALLSTLSDEELTAMGIASPLHRKAVRIAIGKLLADAGLEYPHMVHPAAPAADASAGNTSHLSSSGGPHTPVLTRSLSSSASAAAASLGSPTALALALPLLPAADDRVDVFISYRRKTGAVLAQLLNMYLKAEGLRTFLDVENLGQGAFDVALQRQLAASRNVVVVLSEGALDRCMADHDNKDFVRKEIAMTLAMSKNCVPVVTDDFTFPAAETLPEDIRPIVTLNAVSWSHLYQEASMRKLMSFMLR